VQPDHVAAGPARPRTATAWWTVAPGRGELRSHRLRAPGPGEVTVGTLFSGISRGTERLVHAGLVPPAHAGRMRAPFQHGDLPGPVSYGYLAVGEVLEGPVELVGGQVFVLHPHHDRFVVPVQAVHLLPDGVPARRAVLAGVVETALNVLWDGGVRIGDRVLVVGGGAVGACVARLAGRVPGTRVELVDPDPGRAATAAVLGVGYRHPDELAGDEHVGRADVVVHTSATAGGLALALRLAPDDGEVIEASWFGTQAPAVPLGEDVHVRRVSIRPSQVGAVALARRGRRTRSDRLDLALRLLADPAFEHLLGADVPFADLPARMSGLLGLDRDGDGDGDGSRAGDGRCSVVRYVP